MLHPAKWVKYSQELNPSQEVPGDTTLALDWISMWKRVHFHEFHISNGPRQERLSVHRAHGW